MGQKLVVLILLSFSEFISVGAVTSHEWAQCTYTFSIFYWPTSENAFMCHSEACFSGNHFMIHFEAKKGFFPSIFEGWSIKC